MTNRLFHTQNIFSKLLNYKLHRLLLKINTHQILHHLKWKYFDRNWIRWESCCCCYFSLKLMATYVETFYWREHNKIYSTNKNKSKLLTMESSTHIWIWKENVWFERKARYVELKCANVYYIYKYTVYRAIVNLFYLKQSTYNTVWGRCWHKMCSKYISKQIWKQWKSVFVLYTNIFTYVNGE